ncbi:alpha/beta hydrolase [Janthinobacterium sp. SUN073]|uniref:alpha/beta hydrolase n=1 Tax=Janthinobacterium sp. SUN073 TaxID=3004102 RepID=UPI0025B04A5C|nr:alpha/beta hydrolase [Janthinobacterium sp. SUN073]MDN2697028.1 alpha/beta hydrolase [Janthinobacterium sp. SUN073]
MNNQTTIVLVHGFWGGAAHWSRVIVELRRQGHTAIRAVELPLTSLADDAERTRKMVAQVNGPVLLVGHSYGGAVISVAGNAPNVVGLVYIAAFAPDAGESAGSITQEHPPWAQPVWKATATAICGSSPSNTMTAFARTSMRKKAPCWAWCRKRRWPAPLATPSATRPGSINPAGTRFPVPTA